MTDAGAAFLNYVLAGALNRVNEDNYQLTEDNLDLAKRRLEVGHSGPDEVFRWEAQLASQRVELFDSEASIESQRIAVNQLLALDQSIRWVPEEVEVNEAEFFFLEGRITEVFDDAMTFEKFRSFMVMFGEENSPELLALRSVIEAQGIQLGQRKRQFILPEFGLSFDYNYLFHREPDVAGFDNNLYSFRVFASLPLFEGASRYYDKERIKTAIYGLEFQRALTRDRVERRIRTSIRLIEASYPSLSYSRIAAENAKKNLDVVQEKYSQGIVNVTDLLSAQSESFVTGQQAVVTTYRFLLDLLEFQRALAWFESLKDEEQKDDLVRRVEAVTGIGQ
jgi:outer membrane protein TolC